MLLAGLQMQDIARFNKHSDTIKNVSKPLRCSCDISEASSYVWFDGVLAITVSVTLYR
jgi:hypothetical protein